MSLFEAYFDESYEGSKIMAVAGYIVEASKAKEMDRQWKFVLDEYGLRHFHMVDCAHGDGLFKGMKVETRSEIASKMIQIIERHVDHGISTITNPIRFNRANTGHDPYSFCLWTCVLTLCSWLSDKGAAKVAFFFEDGHGSQSLADRHIKRLQNDPEIAKHYASQTFASKEDARILQAADLLAWQSTKFMKDKVSRKRRPRQDFLRLLKHPHAFQYVVFHNNQVGISMDEAPHIPYGPRDDYLRAMFSYDVKGDRQIERTHAKMIFRQNVLGDVIFRDDDDGRDR